MDVRVGESIHRFIVFSTPDGWRAKIISKQLNDRRIAAEIVFEDGNGACSVYKFTDSIYNSETFEPARFNNVINSLMHLENGQFKKICQKKFVGVWNFSEVNELEANDLLK